MAEITHETRRRPDRSAGLDAIQHGLQPLQCTNQVVKTWANRNRSALRSGDRPSTPRPSHKSVLASPPISWWLTPRVGIGRPQERYYFFPIFDGHPATSTQTRLREQACWSNPYRQSALNRLQEFESDKVSWEMRRRNPPTPAIPWKSGASAPRKALR